MNFYKRRQDQRLANKEHQIAYTARYICIIRTDNDDIVNGSWTKRYLDGTSIDHSVVNKLIVKDFLLDIEELKY